MFDCSHAHYVLSRLMKDAVKTKMSLYCLTVDISGASDNIVHSQALFSLTPSCVNPSVISLLSSWYSKTKIQVTWNGQISDPVKINKGVRQGAVLSPSIFKCLLASCLLPLRSSVFTVILVCLLLHMQTTFFFLPGLAVDCFLILLH